MAIQDRYDIIVVGSGFCGSVIARLAADCGKRVLVLERRGHIAGNMYDEVTEDGFLVQRYGPHVFHTDEDWMYRFLCRFSDWYSYRTVSCVEIDGVCVPVPFGFRAIRLLYPSAEAEQLIEKLLRAFPGRESVSVLDLMAHPDESISSFADMLYQKDYKPYAAKQWNMEPKELDRSVVERLPIILTDRENYFTVKHEVLPTEGFTAFFRNMLTDEQIDILLDTDGSQYLQFDAERGICSHDGEELTIPVVYTGALEDLFNSGTPLPYRSLYFSYQTMETDSYQPAAILAYPQEHEYLRTIEYSKLMRNAGGYSKTIVAFEYPVLYNKNARRGNEPYYPVLTEKNIKRNEEYIRRLKRIKNVFPCGRLADYKYYNMDQAVKRAFDVFEEIKERF